MKSTNTLLLASLTLASASPLQPRADVICGRNDLAQVGPYTLYNNLWGEPSGVGSQCTTVGGLFTPNVAKNGDKDAAAAEGEAPVEDSVPEAETSEDNDVALKWATAWTWSGNSAIAKSFAFVSLDFEPKPVYEIESIPSTWNWSYDGDAIIANVAYSLLTSSDCGTRRNYEITIWLAARGAPYIVPVSATPGTPLVESIALAGSDWALHRGVSTASTVFSFVAASEITAFDGDLHEFVRYLNEAGLVPAEQCLFSLGAGTEVFGGAGAVLKTDEYKAAVHAAEG